MAILKIDRFYGTAPRYGARKLAPGLSQVARNIELFSQELAPIRTHSDVSVPSKDGTPLSIFPLDNYWLHWTTDVDVVRGPIETDTTGRIYYTGDLQPKATNTSLATTGGGTDYPIGYYRLGVPRPDTAPTVTPSATGTGNTVSRSYIYTFVTAWGEEGPPSPVTTASGRTDDTWALTTIDATPPNSGTISAATAGASTVSLTFSASHFLESGDYIVIAGSITGTGALPTDLPGTYEFTRTSATQGTIVLTTSGTYTANGTWAREAPLQTTGWTKYIYRSLGGDYYYVASTTGTSYNDTVADTALGEILPYGNLENEWWRSPPLDLQGLVMAPNGVLAGFVGNTLYMCEPYVPSAWPRKYAKTLDYQIVGLGVVGNTIVVATEGKPYVVIGDHPENMVDRRLNISQPCVSKRGIASAANGVIYPCNIGLVYVPAAGNPTIITDKYVKEKEWALFNPSSIHAALYNERYYGFYEDGGENGDESGAFIFDPNEPESAFTTLGVVATASHTDEENAYLYMVQDGVVTKHEGGSTHLVYSWKSKKYTTSRPACFKAGKVKLENIGIGDAVTLTSAISTLETELSDSALASGFGSDNNYYGGGFGGSAVGDYAVAGGPYFEVISDSLASAETALLTLYADGEVVATKNLVDSSPFRLPGGYRADTFEVQIDSNVMKISEIMLASTMSELSEG